METVPDDPEETALWLHRLFQHKVTPQFKLLKQDGSCAQFIELN